MQNFKSAILMAAITLLCLSFASARPLDVGGEGVGGGIGQRVSPPGPGTPKDWLYRSTFYQNSLGPLHDVARYARSLRVALNFDEAMVRRSLIKVVSDGGSKINATNVSVAEGVEHFLNGFKSMQAKIQSETGRNIEEFIYALELKRVDSCIDHTGASVDLCTELFDLSSPIRVAKKFWDSQPTMETYAGLLYHEVTRKLLGQEDDNHIHASVMKLSYLFHRDGFFTQTVCQTKEVSCTNRDFIIDGIIPIPEFKCVDITIYESEWYFDINQAFSENQDSISFGRDYWSRSVTLQRKIENNVGIHMAQYATAKPDLAGRFDFLMIDGYDPKQPHGYKLSDSYGCSSVASTFPAVTAEFHNIWYQHYTPSLIHWDDVCGLDGNPHNSEAYCKKIRSWPESKFEVLHSLYPKEKGNP